VKCVRTGVHTRQHCCAGGTCMWGGPAGRNRNLAGCCKAPVAWLASTRRARSRAGGAAAQAVAALEFDARGPAGAELAAALARMLARAHGDARAVRARFAAVRQAAALAADAAAARQDALRELACNARARALTCFLCALTCSVNPTLHHAPYTLTCYSCLPGRAAGVGLLPCRLCATGRRPTRGRSPGRCLFAGEPVCLASRAAQRLHARGPCRPHRCPIGPENRAIQNAENCTAGAARACTLTGTPALAACHICILARPGMPARGRHTASAPCTSTRARAPASARALTRRPARRSGARRPRPHARAAARRASARSWRRSRRRWPARWPARAAPRQPRRLRWLQPAHLQCALSALAPTRRLCGCALTRRGPLRHTPAHGVRCAAQHAAPARRALAPLGPLCQCALMACTVQRSMQHRPTMRSPSGDDPACARRAAERAAGRRGGARRGGGGRRRRGRGHALGGARAARRRLARGRARVLRGRSGSGRRRARRRCAPAGPTCTQVMLCPTGIVWVRWSAWCAQTRGDSCPTHQCAASAIARRLCGGWPAAAANAVAVKLGRACASGGCRAPVFACEPPVAPRTPGAATPPSISGKARPSVERAHNSSGL